MTPKKARSSPSFFSMRTILRTPEMWDRYASHKADGCFLCKEKPVDESDYWHIFPNEFAYDAVADMHMLLALKRHDTQPNLQELAELIQLLPHLDCEGILYNQPQRQSVKGHLHLHLINWKKV
jgi:hypothetical protein